MDGEDTVEVFGSVLDLECCPECGGHAIRTDYKFKIDEPTRIRNTKYGPRKIDREQRTYLHCSCGHCTTEWQRPLYNGDTSEVLLSSFERAKEAWRNKKWAKVH